MGNERAEQLIKKYLEGNATPEEEALLEAWYIEAAKDQPDMPGQPDYDKIREEILRPLREEQEDLPVIKSPVRLWPRIAAAASILIILSIGAFLVFRKRPTQKPTENLPLAGDILPAGTKATLTLIDGKTVPLDSTGTDQLVRQDNTIISAHNGLLIYSSHDQPQRTNLFNTLTTRPGEHYAVQLPDGTKAWLNAASSITYPVAFNATERKVTVTGEVYLEIAHNAKQPFRLTVRNQTIEDIGTQFNVNAYEDEPAINTTLVEGSIRVSKGNTSTVLTPGQQASSKPDDSTFKISPVNTEEATAWKNGYFYFDHADIKTVMRELARWYDVQIIYKGEITKRTFKGKVYRNINASEALNILSFFGAHFSIEGRTITVSS